MQPRRQMAKCAFAFLVCATLVHARADSPNEADYPAQYEVMNTSTISGSPFLLMPGICTMALRDLAYPGTGLVVQRKGSCHVWDAGAVFHGRREKNGISLLVQDKGKLKVEHWPITGTVAINPQVSGVSVAVAEKGQESVPVGELGSLFFASIPDGADIYVDGEFMGNSPAALKLKLGKHTISAKMSGYQDWDREITVSGGTVNLNATLTALSNSLALGSNPGVTMRPETPVAAASSAPGTEKVWIGLSTASGGSTGATVAGVYPGGPAALAGLKSGDVITQIEEKTVTSGKAFETEIMHYKPGSQVKVRYMRGAWVSQVTMTVGRE
jgi:PDZ domain/PEGA domain